MTIVLFGKNGQLGWELQRTLVHLGELVSRGSERGTDLCGNLTDPDGLRRTVRSLEPEIIVNAAAYTAVDKAESEVELAMAVNADAPRVLAEEAEAVGASFVHYSTDFVFDGHKARPYSESDSGNPLSAYGRSKLAGDIAVANSCSRYLIFRTGWVFGAHGDNFPKTILRSASERTSLAVVDDQVGTPTSAGLIAEATATVLADMAVATPEDARWGLYNLVAKGQASWYEFANHVVKQAGSKGMQLNLSSEAIEAIASSEYPLPAVRPSYSVLDTTKVRETFGLSLPCWETGVDEVLDRIVGV